MKPVYEQKKQKTFSLSPTKSYSLIAPNQQNFYYSILTKICSLKVGTFLTIFGLFCFALIFCLTKYDNGIINLFPNIWSRIIVQVGQFIFIINVLALLWRIYLVLTYKPESDCPTQKLPFLTVVIPAYNEGRQVAETMISVADSNYPIEKLQIIAVDDGSQDDTWLWMQQATTDRPGRFTPIRLSHNMGKRHALYEGFRQSDGEILVTLDSDSVIEPMSLRHLISPIVKDKIVGGVGGNVRVLNLKAGLIPRMMEVAFAFGFDFLRASHSRVNAVMCTPGAFSAYRKSAVMPILNQWLNETWLGKPYRIGEDRYLTNLILQEGYHVVFQSNAMVFTKVPIKYKGLVKMLLRWARSDLRESINMNKFIFKKFRQSSALGARTNLLLSWVDMTICQVLMVNGIIYLFTLPAIVILYTLIASAAIGLIPMIVYLLRHRHLRALWAIPYSIFYVIALAWIPVYAIITIHKSGWLTRQINFQSRRSWQQIASDYYISLYATSGLLAILIVASVYYWNTHINIPPPILMQTSSPKLQSNSHFHLPHVISSHEENDTRVQALRWSLSAAHSSLDQKAGLLNLERVELILYQKDGSKFCFQGDRAEYDPSDRIVILEGNVKGVTTNGISLSTRSLSYSEADKLVETNDEVVLTGQHFEFKGRGITMDIAKNRTVFKKAASSRVIAVIGQSIPLSTTIM